MIIVSLDWVLVIIGDILLNLILIELLIKHKGVPKELQRSLTGDVKVLIHKATRGVIGGLGGWAHVQQHKVAKAVTSCSTTRHSVFVSVFD